MPTLDKGRQSDFDLVQLRVYQDSLMTKFGKRIFKNDKERFIHQ